VSFPAPNLAPPAPPPIAVDEPKTELEPFCAVVPPVCPERPVAPPPIVTVTPVF